MDDLSVEPDAEEAAFQRYEALSHSLVAYLAHKGVGCWDMASPFAWLSS